MISRWISQHNPLECLGHLHFLERWMMKSEWIVIQDNSPASREDQVYKRIEEASFTLFREKLWLNQFMTPKFWIPQALGSHDINCSTPNTRKENSNVKGSLYKIHWEKQKREDGHLLWAAWFTFNILTYSSQYLWETDHPPAYKWGAWDAMQLLQSLPGRVWQV